MEGLFQQHGVALICIDPSLILTLLLSHSCDQSHLRFLFTPTRQILDARPKKINSEPHLGLFVRDGIPSDADYNSTRVGVVVVVVVFVVVVVISLFCNGIT